MKQISGVLILVLACSFPVFSKTCKTYELEYQAWSSSYLPLKSSPMTHVLPSRKLYQGLGLTEAEILRSAELPLIEKYEKSMKDMLGKEVKLKEKFLEEFRNEDSASWEGFCHKWAAASLDRNFAEIFQREEAVRCKDVVYTLGELKELATAFHHSNELLFFGMKTQKEEEKIIAKFKEDWPVDDLRPGLFRSELLYTLKNNEGMIIDADSGPEIWNHPIYKNEECIEEYEQELSIPDVGPFIYKIPLSFLKANGKTSLAELEHQQLTFFKELSRLFSAPMAITSEVIADKVNHMIQLMRAKLSEINKPQEEILYTSLRSRMSEMRRLQNLIISNFYLIDGKLNLKPGYQLQEIDMKISYMDEVIFNDPGRHARDRELKLGEILDEKGKSIFSFWITDYKKRPDFAWVPQNTKYLYGDMQDLVDLIGSCEPLSYSLPLEKISRDYNLSEQDGLRNYLRIFMAKLLGL